MLSHNRTRGIGLIAGAAALTLGLAGCAGSAGGGSNAAEGGSGDGYEYGASPEEIKAAFADVDPITIKYQPSAQGPDGADAYRAHAFIENLEELSDGKITVETTYAQGIAGYTELADALVDGRVDVAYMLPIYQSDQFPVFQGWVTGTTLTGTSPLLDELAANAAIGELTMNDENLISEFRDQGLEPLNQFNAAGVVFSMCSDEHLTAEDWQGNSVRASSSAQSTQLEALDATPVSLQYTETFEALQRNTVDCTLSTTLAADAAGFMDVAPNISYTTDVTFARGPGGVYAGSAWNTWPLAVQQLVFDSMQDEFIQSRRGDLEANAIGAQVARDKNGSFKAMDDDIQSKLLESSKGLVEAEVEAGNLPEGSVEEIPAAVERWRGVVEELGYSDDGGFEDYDEWYPVDDEEFLDAIGQRYFEDILLPHRPGA